MRNPTHEEILTRQAHCLLSIEALLREMRDVDSGRFVAVPRRLLIDAAHPFHTFKVRGDGDFHSVQIDNPSAVDVEVVIGGTQPLAGSSDKRVPKQSSRILTFPYNELAIGIDPAVVPAGQTILYVTFYARPLQPTLDPFAP